MLDVFLHFPVTLIDVGQIDFDFGANMGRTDQLPEKMF